MLRPYRPPLPEPVFIYSSDTPQQCGICVRVFFVAEVGGTSRSSHRRGANEQYYASLGGSGAPQNASSIRRGMERGQGQFRNPDGYEWHHPIHRPGEIWLITRCEHRSPFNQPLLHPNQEGGFAVNFGGSK